MTLKLIHIGLGGWGMDWQKTALRTIADHVETVAIVEPNNDLRATAQSVLGLKDARCFVSLADAVQSVDAEAVLITASVPAHVPLAIEAMEAGLHVLSEKPLAPTLDDARSAIAVANRTGRIYMISQNYRQYPAPRTVARLLASGELGAIGPVSVDFRKWVNDEPAGTHPYYALLHPLLFDMAIHHWDLMRYVLDAEPTSVFVQNTSPAWSKFRDESSATAVIPFSNGSTVTWKGSWVSPDADTCWAGSWRMETERGTLIWTSRAGGPVGTGGDSVEFRDRTTGRLTAIPMDPMPIWGRSANVLAFIDAIRTGREPETSARRNLGSLALMVATAESMATGVSVTIEPVADAPDA